jgi:hypothetical protein
LGLRPNQTVSAAHWQILYVKLFRRFPLTRDEFWHKTGAIGRFMKFCFQPYIARPKPTPYATWASILLCTAPGLRTGLELELLLASTSETRTGSTLDLLLDMETFVGLLLHSMHQSWSYAWVSCPDQQRCTRHPSMFPSKKSGEKPTQIRGITPRTKAPKNKHEKDHEIHNAESSIQTRKDSQGLACHPSIHPSQQISHEALMLA